MAYVVFGVMPRVDEDTDDASIQKTSLPSSLQKVPVSERILMEKTVWQVSDSSQLLCLSDLLVRFMSL